MVYCQSDSTVYNRHAVGRRVHVAFVAYRRETRYKFDSLTIEKAVVTDRQLGSKF